MHLEITVASKIYTDLSDKDLKELLVVSEWLDKNGKDLNVDFFDSNEILAELIRRRMVDFESKGLNRSVGNKGQPPSRKKS